MNALFAASALFLCAGIVAQRVPPPLTSDGLAEKGFQPQRIPVVGLGTWHIHDNDNNVTDMVARALEMGYRHIDCAYAYGNQKLLGKGIAYGLERTGLAREDIWITSKLWNNRHGNAQYALEETLNQLGLDYLDLFLVHWPFGNSTGSATFDYLEAWKEMEQLIKPTRGTRFIGISNFNPAQLNNLLRIAKVKPAVHQFEAHPYLQQTSFVQFNIRNQIAVTAYAPLGNTNPVYGDAGKNQPPLLSHPIIAEIANRNGCKLAQVPLMWNIQRGVAVIPKAASLDHAKENLRGLENCKLSQDDVERLNLLEAKLRVNWNPCRSMNFTCFDGMDGGPYGP